MNRNNESEQTSLEHKPHKIHQQGRTLYFLFTVKLIPHQNKEFEPGYYSHQVHNFNRSDEIPDFLYGNLITDQNNETEK